MWFKNLVIYRISQWDLTAAQLEEKLSRNILQECSGISKQSAGWISQNDDEAQLVRSWGRQILITLGVEAKVLPSQVVNQSVKSRASKLEAAQGFKPGRKQLKEIKESVVDELLPRAFAVRRRTNGWIDPEGGWLVIDAASMAKADEFIEMLFKIDGDFSIELIKTKISPSTAMTQWLFEESLPSGFSIDRDCELQAPGLEKAGIRYVRHSLNGKEIGKHIKEGMRVTKLSLTWNNRISFSMQENMQLKKVEPLDILTEQSEENEGEDKLAADFLLMAGEVGQLLPTIMEALGGET